jgi:hypothetical protein
MRSWNSILLLLLLLTGVAQGAPDQDRSAELARMLDRALVLGDRAPSRLYYGIAAGRDTQAFSVLKDALAPLEDPGSACAAYGACSLFKGSAIEDHVVGWLANQTFKATHPAQQLGATQALTYFWRTAEEDLLRILRNHPARGCRERALEPMIPILTSRGDRSSCKLLLDNASPTGRGRPALIGALKHFTSTPAETMMASKLRDKKTSNEMKLVLLDSFAARRSSVARIAIDRRLNDPDEEVRLRAINILGRGDDPETLRKLRGVAQQGSPEFVIAAMLSLAEQHEGDPDWIKDLYAFTQSHEISVRCGAAKALGRLPTQDSLTLLHRLLKDREVEVQLTALGVIAEHRQLQSIPKLIASLGDPQALITHEIARTLRLLTGQDHGVSRKRWEAWFDEEGAGLQVPTVAESLRLEHERTARKNPTGKYRTASFYGIEIRANKICFIVDTSGSMAERAGGRGTSSLSRRTTRIAVAKTELSNSLNQLLNGVRFNIITFESRVSPYQKKLIELDSKSRADALKRIKSWHASGGTAIFDAINLALTDKDVEAIYLLTDGEPTEGRLIDIDQILERVDAMTRSRKIKFHGVAIGQRSRLLRELSRRSGGQYVEIF